MRWVQLNVPRSITVDLPRRPTAAGTFVVKSVGGGTLQTAVAPTLDAVNTTLTAGVAAGALVLPVTSATGVSAGRRFLLAGEESVGGETVTVRSVNGLNVTLMRPLRAAQATGATFQGTRLTFAIGAAGCATTGRNHRIEWTPAAGDEDLATVLPFDVTRYAPVTFLNVEDLRDMDPLFAKRLNAGTSLPAVRERAWEVLLSHLSQQIDPGGVPGTADLTIAHGYLVRALVAETAGKKDEDIAYLEDMRTRYAQERDNTMGALAYDANQTGKAKNRTGWSGHSIKLIRT